MPLPIFFLETLLRVTDFAHSQMSSINQPTYIRNGKRQTIKIRMPKVARANTQAMMHKTTIVTSSSERDSPLRHRSDRFLISCKSIYKCTFLFLQQRYGNDPKAPRNRVCKLFAFSFAQINGLCKLFARSVVIH